MSITMLLPFSSASQLSIRSCSAVLRENLAEGRHDTYSPGLRAHHHASHTESTIDTLLSLAAWNLSLTFVRRSDSVPVAVMALQEWEHCCWFKLAQQPHKLLAHCWFSQQLIMHPTAHPYLIWGPPHLIFYSPVGLGNLQPTHSFAYLNTTCILVSRHVLLYF